MVYEAKSDEQVTAYVRNYEIEREKSTNETALEEFFDIHVENENKGDGVLQEYVNLIHSSIDKEVERIH